MTQILTFEGELREYDHHGHRLFPLTDLQLAQLKADLNPDRIASRSQGGAKLSYLEAWDVQRMLIKVFGFGGFSVETTETKVLTVTPTKMGKDKDRDGFIATALVTVSIHIHQLGATYTCTTASSQTNPDPGEATDFAVKTAESDSLKRAAKNMGTAFGLSLYNNGSFMDVVGDVLAAGQRRIDADELRALRIKDQQRQVVVITDGLEPTKDQATQHDEQIPDPNDIKVVGVDVPGARAADGEAPDYSDGEPDPDREAKEAAAHEQVQASFTLPDEPEGDKA